MKKNILLPLILSLFVIGGLTYYFVKQNQEKQKELIATQPVFVASLKEVLESKGINIEASCLNQALMPSDLIDLKNKDQKKRFDYLCEDLALYKKLEANFATSTDYTYFLECAKNYAHEMQLIQQDLKAHYPEDYQALSFKQEDTLLKYLKHPASAYLQVQCEAKAEALYWNAIVKSGKVEDLNFCIETLEGCAKGFAKADECPAKAKEYYEECNLSRKKMRH